MRLVCALLAAWFTVAVLAGYNVRFEYRPDPRPASTALP